MSVIETIMKAIQGLFGKKSESVNVQPRMTISAKMPIKGEGEDRDIWMVYKEE